MAKDDSIKAMWDNLARKGSASGNDRWLTEASIEKANIDEVEAELRKDTEEIDRIVATGETEAVLARLKDLHAAQAKRQFRIYTWDRLFPTKKQRSS